MIDRLLQWMVGLPEALIYAVVGAFAALENVFPPVPADVVALFGGFLAGRGAANAWVTFLVVWLCNVTGAMTVYALGRRYGTAFFRNRVGSLILQPGQFARLSEFYARHGEKVIFISRFLPMFRAVVPIFAGTSKLGWVRTLVPLAVASGLWYGGIVYLGATAGRNWADIRRVVDASGHWLAVPAGILLVVFAWWWWHTRRRGKP
ncbi:MAG: associated protein [Gemmatimonadetes bacterium]|nr:associated protein [Gemmatimonadota bacterium]